MRKFQKAVTLIELLVVIAIVAIMGTASITTIQRRNDAKDVEMSARQLAVDLRQLQNDALSGQKAGLGCASQFYIQIGYDPATGNTDPSSYYLGGGGISPNNVNIPGTGASCNGDINNPGNPALKKTFLKKVTIDGSGNGQSYAAIRFLGPFGDVSGVYQSQTSFDYPLPANGGLQFKIKKNGSMYYVCVCRFGEIKETQTVVGGKCPCN